MQSSAADGTMGKALGLDITGWHVTNVKQQPKSRRRRQIHATPTPVITETPPTKMVDKVDSTMVHSVPIMSSPAVVEPTHVMPEPGEETMMTKLPDMGTDKMPDGHVTPTPGSEPEPGHTEILPSKTHIMTDAPPTDLPTSPNCPDDTQNRGPALKNRMPPSLTFTGGRVAHYTVPNDLFYDCVYGDVKGLKLNLFVGREYMALPGNSWLSLKQRKDKSWVIEGMPMNNNEGTYDYRITATNKDGVGAAFEDFDVLVLDGSTTSEPPSHEVALTLDNNYDTFTIRDSMQVTKKIGKVFGDANPNSIAVLRIAKGSVIFAYTNTTLPTGSCPAGEISDLTKKLVDENGNINKKAQMKMRPYKLAGIAVQPMGKCEGNDQFPFVVVGKQPSPVTDTPKEPIEPAEPAEPITKDPPYVVEGTTSEPEKGAQEDDDSEVWITTVVPAVVIVAILLLALVIACVLYRKKRKGKMSLEDKNTFVNKGTPVIFPDEYDEKPNDSTKPLIMDDEKPPMPPPEYTRASSESSRSSDNKNEIEEHEMDETDVHSPLYQPPPPITSSGGNKDPRPHVQPPTQNPAPYVPP